MTFIARGGSIRCKNPTVLIGMASVAGLLPVPSEYAFLGGLGVPNRMALMAWNRGLPIAQREPGCCVISHTQG